MKDLFFRDGSLLPWRSSLFMYFLFLVESSAFLFSVGFSVLMGKECFVLFCPYNSGWQSHCPSQFLLYSPFWQALHSRLSYCRKPLSPQSRTLSPNYWVKNQACFLCSDISLLVFCATVLLVNTVCFCLLALGIPTHVPHNSLEVTVELQGSFGWSFCLCLHILTAMHYHTWFMCLNPGHCIC